MLKTLKEIKYEYIAYGIIAAFVFRFALDK
jgi:hypothetical protein